MQRRVQELQLEAKSSDLMSRANSIAAAGGDEGKDGDKREV